jgi:DNA replication protein DnaC
MRAEAMQHTYTWLGARWADSDLVAKTFATFQVERQARAYEAAQAFVANPEGTLVLYGTFGTGKTHLLAAICNASLHQQKPTKSLFTTSPNLFAAIQARIQAKEDYTGILTAAIQTPLLVLDDIDKAKWSEFREEVYFEMVDKRVKAGRPIAISTNKLDALAHYVGGAVCSRFKVGQIAIEMVGADFREEL